MSIHEQPGDETTAVLDWETAYLAHHEAYSIRRL
jgi:hypothetical protein